MSEEAEAIKKLVVTALEQDRHGVSLQGGLVKPLAAYLVGALKVERIPQDLPDTQEEWLKTANEAFEADGATLPGAFETRLRRWLKGDGLKEASGKDMPLKSGGGLGSRVHGHYDTLAFELGVTPAAVEEAAVRRSLGWSAHPRSRGERHEGSRYAAADSNPGPDGGP